MTMGRLLKLDRPAAARFSFLMSLPITAAVGLLKAKDIINIPATQVSTFLVGTIVAAIVGALSIGFLLNYLRRASFAVFAIYRLAFAAFILMLWFVRG
jgi:undecaprenyl-diphosphatase